MKKFSLIASLFLSFIVLAACHRAQDLMAFGSHPLLSQVHTGMTQQQVTEKAGAPTNQQARKIKPGQCFNYSLKKGDKVRPFYVGFDTKGVVDAYGFGDCTGK